jgi:hypothetical protein
LPITKRVVPAAIPPNALDNKPANTPRLWFISDFPETTGRARRIEKSSTFVLHAKPGTGLFNGSVADFERGSGLV